MDSESGEAVAGPGAIVAAGATVIALSAAFLWLFDRLWGRAALADAAGQPGGWIGAILVVVCSAALHELVHALAWTVLARVPWRAISLRKTFRVMGLVAALDEPVAARAYRAGVAAPAMLMGLTTGALGLFFGAGLLVLWGCFFVLECFADFAVLYATRGLPAGARVVTHPTRLGVAYNGGP